MKSLKTIYTNDHTEKGEETGRSWSLDHCGGRGRGGGSKIILNMAHFGECLPRLAPETGFVSAHCLCQ